jgi:hypothetical protein
MNLGSLFSVKSQTVISWKITGEMAVCRLMIIVSLEVIQRAFEIWDVSPVCFGLERKIQQEPPHVVSSDMNFAFTCKLIFLPYIYPECSLCLIKLHNMQVYQKTEGCWINFMPASVPD